MGGMIELPPVASQIPGKYLCFLVTNATDRQNKNGELDIIWKNPTSRNFFLKVETEYHRACLNSMSWNPAISNQATPPGSRHLIVGDSLARDLNETFVTSQTTVLSF